MNSVVLIGRLTRDPELRYTPSTQMAVATFSIAIDRPVRAGGEKQTDFPRVTVFGKQAENCERFLAKGRLVGVQGRLQTGSYQNKNGDTVYTTDVVADRVEFLEWGDRPQGGFAGQRQQSQDNVQSQDFSQNSGNGQDFGMQSNQSSDFTDIPAAFEAIDEDLPF
ncbi:single-strand DNA-binding protein [Peptostreptococcaceae bacterium pGA-8]|nr:single-strand DNA-binding protein [Peptostreptococcaceae bacterium pGA-8]